MKFQCECIYEVNVLLRGAGQLLKQFPSFQLEASNHQSFDNPPLVPADQHLDHKRFPDGSKQTLHLKQNSTEIASVLGLLEFHNTRRPIPSQPRPDVHQRAALCHSAVLRKASQHSLHPCPGNAAVEPQHAFSSTQPALQSGSATLRNDGTKFTRRGCPAGVSAVTTATCTMERGRRQKGARNSALLRTG